MGIDFYRVLGVQKYASDEEIKKAHRKITPIRLPPQMLKTNSKKSERPMRFYQIRKGVIHSIDLENRA